ncbi:Syntaxin-11 [Dissostichus eleginoides]|uniref:Syntaxin-11 n=1 Tax=Dissostichus eleginoides TaxID=100907 RepID=A0AAD9F9F6_DISEL|nr:Syntaxin-11 [Dissostichus eleginoides]
MENRQRELLELEQRIREIHDLFAQMASLVEEQGFMLDNIQANVGATQDYVAKANVQIKGREVPEEPSLQETLLLLLPLLQLTPLFIGSIHSV